MAKSNIQTINVNRVFETREKSRFGAVRIGQVECVVNVESITINGQAVPPAGLEHLFTFMLQSLQDAYAGAESEIAARDAFEGKLARIIDGTIGTRSAGDGASALHAEIRAFIRPDVKKAVGAEAWKSMDEKDRVSAIDAAFDQQSDDVKAAITQAAQERMDAKVAEAAKLANVKAGIALKITK